MTKKVEPFLGLERVTSDSDCVCGVCHAAPKQVLACYFGNFVVFLCPLCEMTFLSMWLNNYVRRKRRGKTKLVLVKDSEVGK